jgi:polyphosphate kinase
MSHQKGQPRRASTSTSDVPRAAGSESYGPPEQFQNRDLSWLAFARRVLALVEDAELPLMERVKFAGIMGQLHDEFFMKRVSDLRYDLETNPGRSSVDGRTPDQELAACRREVLAQVESLDAVLGDDVFTRMKAAGIGVLDYAELGKNQRASARHYFKSSVLPILTPLAVDAEHPFPFISSLVLNLAVMLPDDAGRERFVRIKVPDNRPRWVPLPGGSGWVPIEQVIVANLDRLFPTTPPLAAHVFRVTRAVEGTLDHVAELGGDVETEPGVIVQVVSSKLRARRFAQAVRLEVDRTMPEPMVRWLVEQLDVRLEDVYACGCSLALADLVQLKSADPQHYFPGYTPVPPPRLAHLSRRPEAIFEEIARGDVLVHHPYDSFDASVLRFLESAATDPSVLAIKLTIYRTSSDSPIIRALGEAARRGKQVAVLVEITAKFDEAPNIAWGDMLEQEGVHVAYGVERLKTHVKLALVVREERGRMRRYAHIGTGNYHTGTARLYEDLGLITCDPDICADVSAVFNSLTGGSPSKKYGKMLVAPLTMREGFVALVRREAEHARAGRPSGIYAKMNQLQDPAMICELYAASQAGVPITLNVRGLCCLRPGVVGLSDNIRLYSVIWRFLEHSRIYRFENAGRPEYFTGSADWMVRNLNKRVETITPVEDQAVQAQIDRILAVYEADNTSAWDGLPDGTYVRRNPVAGDAKRPAQDQFLLLASRQDE